jgi:uncharacterized protein with HEPN domain
MSFEPRDYLRHILAEADYLLATSEDLTFDAFVTNETLQRAFVRSLGIIGEAAKKVPDGFSAKHPDIEWRAMAGMRDRLIPRLLRRRLRDRLGCGREPDPRASASDRYHPRGITSGCS